MLTIVVVAAVGLALMLLFVLTSSDSRVTRLRTRRFRCPFRDADVAVEFREDAWDRLPIDVVSCTAFNPPFRVGCRKPCLDHPVARGAASAVA